MPPLVSIRACTLFLLAASVGVLAMAFAFQHLGGLAPCVLCIWQRYPYVGAIVLAMAAYFLRERPPLAAGAVLLAGLVFLAGAGIGAFHVGVEQGWWQGTAACGGERPASASVEELYRRLMETTAVARCDVIPWSLFGISMAGYNIVLSLGLAAMAFFGGARIAGGRIT